MKEKENHVDVVLFVTLPSGQGINQYGEREREGTVGKRYKKKEKKCELLLV